MNWLKRNLFLSVGGVVALLLLGASGFYLNAERSRHTRVSTELENQIKEWRRLTSRKPSATDTNIALAKQEVKRLDDLFGKMRDTFVPPSLHTNVDSMAFKSLLETTIFNLLQSADRQGVQLPRRYSFTFQALRESVQFEPKDLGPLSYQVSDINGLCEVLFGSRVHSLLRVRRVAISKLDQGNTDFLYGKKITTNTVTGAVISPYEVIFQGFSAELASVLAGLQGAPECFLVKNISVRPAVTVTRTGVVSPAGGIAPPYTGGQTGTGESGWSPTETPGATDETGTPVYRSPEDRIRDRYGLGPAASSEDRIRQRYGLGPAASSEDRIRQRYGLGPSGPGSRYSAMGPGSRYGPQGPGARYNPPIPPYAGPAGMSPSPYQRPPPARSGPETVLDEQLLTITLYVEAVRLTPPAN